MLTQLVRVLLTVTLTLAGSLAYASDNPIFAFAVKIGGQDAKPTNEIFATIDKPVAADAEIEVEGSPAMLILNVVKSDKQGNVDAGAAPVVIMAQNSNKVKLDATMDKSKLAPGTYIANIVQAEKGTSRVLFTVQ